MPSKTKQPQVRIIDDWRSKSMTGLPVLSSRFSPPTGQTLPQPVAKISNEPQSKSPAIDPSNAIAMSKRGALSGVGEPYNISTTLDSGNIQAAIRMAERGDTWRLFTIYRDMIAGFSHLQNEFAKRKLTVVGQPHSVLPRDKKSKDDKVACAVIEEMISRCDNWMDAMDNLLDATLWPVAVAEKLYEPVSPSEAKDYENPVRYRLRKLDPVSPTLFCYKIPYLTSGLGGPSLMGITDPSLTQSVQPLGQESVRWDANDWEPELRFYEVFDNGYPNFSPASTYPPDKARHLIHRGTNLSKTIRDNFGGHLRSILPWWFLYIQGRDWWGRYMQRWGGPFILGKVDVQQKDTVAFMQGALSQAMEIGGLVIDKNAEAQLMQAASLNGAEGYRLFIETCCDEVSKVVIGQTLSSSAKPTGLGSGVAQLQGQVRQDLRQSDMRKLSETLTKEVFSYYLRINGYKGHVKGIIWGGKDEQQVESLASSMKDFSDSGLEATDEGIEVISERIGFGLQRMPREQVIGNKTAKKNGNGDSKKLKKDLKKVKSYVAFLDGALPTIGNLRNGQNNLAAIQAGMGAKLNALEIAGRR